MSHAAVRRFVAAVALMLAASGPAFAQCSANTVRGAWGVQSRGTVLMSTPGYPVPVPVPFVSLGVMEVDSEGSYALRGTISVGGQVQDVEGSGVIRVQPDCTATATDSAGATAQIVIFDGGREMRLMTTTFPLGPSSNMAYFRRIAAGEPRCTNATVQGEYRGSAEGTFMVPVPGLPQPVPMPFSGMFRMAFDRDGGGVAEASALLGGTAADVSFTDIAMTVNRDCTATLEYSGVVQQLPGQLFSGTLKYIVLDHGNELIGMEVASSVGLPIELENHKRVSMRPAVAP